MNNKKYKNIVFSEFCLGCSDIKKENIKYFIDKGGNFLDTSPFYMNGQSEKIIGNFGKRKDLIISTKVGLSKKFYGLSCKNINESLNQSLKNLKTDYIDILWVHCWDGTFDFFKILEKIKKSGKARFLGFCNTPSWVIAQNPKIFDFIQIEYNFLNRTAELELIPFAKFHQMNILSWSIFCKGFKKNKKWSTQENNKTINKIKKIGDIFKLSLLWIKKNNFLPIIRTNKNKNLDLNIKNWNDKIPYEDLEIIEKITKPKLISPYDFLNSKTIQSIQKNQFQYHHNYCH